MCQSIKHQNEVLPKHVNAAAALQELIHKRIDQANEAEWNKQLKIKELHDKIKEDYRDTLKE